ncbi:MAG: hypothetical protein JWM53_1979, partial [bacterium]|nr:hypothetical protein [bacterium]
MSRRALSRFAAAATPRVLVAGIAFAALALVTTAAVAHPPVGVAP